MSRLPHTRTRIVLVDKPSGPTSFEVVRGLRPVLGRKVGHAGTLDPLATGLLVLLAGQATRISDLIMELPKEYVVTAQFGAASSTHDAAGDLTATGIRVSEDQVRNELHSFRGCIRQKVPLTSAVKVGGVPLYRRAHRGEVCDTPEREVVVHDLVLEHFDGEKQQAVLRLRTSKGTYVRTLVHDLGQRLGAGAYATELRRLRVGHLDVADAVNPEQVAAELARPAGSSRAVLTVSAALLHLPRYYVRGAEEARVRNGNELKGAPAGLMRIYGEQGLLAIYEGREGMAHSRVVFPEAES